MFGSDGAMLRFSRLIAFLLAVAAAFAWGAASGTAGATAKETQARISGDLDAGRSIVVHVIVALCDNVNQGIVPVPKHLGNGQDPGSNLYWGALYGVRGFFSGKGGWTTLSTETPAESAIRQRVVFYREVTRGDGLAGVYVVADAWDGAEIKSAIERFLAIAGGAEKEVVSFRRGSNEATISAGGSSHLAAFVGHNGLMDFTLGASHGPVTPHAASSSIVLACASKSYFLHLLREVGSHPLLLTTGLMAPEAYTLDAAIQSWARGGSVAAVREAAAAAYQKYQKCGRQAARNLFWGEEP